MWINGGSRDRGEEGRRRETDDGLDAFSSATEGAFSADSEGNQDDPIGPCGVAEGREFGIDEGDGGRVEEGRAGEMGVQGFQIVG